MEGILRNSKEIEVNKISENWGSLCWLAAASLGNSENVAMARVVIKEGCSNVLHRHNTCDEILYLLKGKLKHVVGSETIIIEPGDILTVRRGMPHKALNIGENEADMIVVYSAGDRDFEAVNDDPNQ